MNKFNNHLSSEEIAICAEAIAQKRFDSVDVNLRRHLSKCDQCSSEVMMVANITSDIKLESENVTPDKKKKTRYIIISVLAAAAVVFFAVFVFSDFLSGSVENQISESNGNDEYVISKQDNQNNPTSSLDNHTESDTGNDFTNDDVSSPNNNTNLNASAKDNKDNDTDDNFDLKKNENHDLIIARFEPNSELEKLIDRFDSNMRSNGNIVIASENNLKLKEGDSLKWNNELTASLLVELVDNQNQRIVLNATSENFMVLPALDPGLYYWKVIDSESYDLLHMGKFTFPQ